MKRTCGQITTVAAVLAACVVQGQIPVAGNPPTPPPAGGGTVPAAVPATTATDAAGADADVLTFLNGDRLHGTLVAVAPAGFGLRWKSGEMEAPAAFSLARVDRARFGRKGAADTKTTQAQVRLSNDDVLRGEIVALDGESLTLKTAYAGNVVLRRAMLSQVWPGKGVLGVVYEGPEDISGWVMGEGGGGRMRGAWTVKDGQLINGPNQYPIGRELRDLPDAAEIQFTVATSGPYLQMCVGFCSDNVRQFSGNGYMLQFSGNSGYLYRRSDNAGNNNLGQGFQFADGRGNATRKAIVRIFLDRAKKQIALVVNGQMLRQWTDPSGFPGTGKGLIFQCNDGNRYRFSNIRAAAWDGRLPQGGESSDGNSPTDNILLANGDKVSGKVATIKNGSVKFETSYAAMEIPVERITEIAFGKEGRQKARLNKNDVQCQFSGGGRLTVDLVSIGEAQVVGKSENFGEIKLALTALEGILFNPWSRPTEDTAREPTVPDEGDPVEIE
jgi:hypothetical protein